MLPDPGLGGPGEKRLAISSRQVRERALQIGPGTIHGVPQSGHNSRSVRLTIDAIIEPLVIAARARAQRIAEAAGGGGAHLSQQRAGDIGYGRAVVESPVRIGPLLCRAIAVAFQRGVKALEDDSRGVRRSRVSNGANTW